MLRKRRALLPFASGVVGKSVGGSHPSVQAKAEKLNATLPFDATPALVNPEDFEAKESNVDNIYLPPSAGAPTEKQQQGFGQAFSKWWNTGDWK